ncbi:MAG: hypothetical protein O3A84_04335 [Proteobacteria bacterium]|nr:hypothetical protein [Pseudomonadota bacterium]
MTIFQELESKIGDAEKEISVVLRQLEGLGDIEETFGTATAGLAEASSNLAQLTGTIRKTSEDLSSALGAFSRASQSIEAASSPRHLEELAKLDTRIGELERHVAKAAASVAQVDAGIGQSIELYSEKFSDVKALLTELPSQMDSTVRRLVGDAIRTQTDYIASQFRVLRAVWIITLLGVFGIASVVGMEFLNISF